MSKKLQSLLIAVGLFVYGSTAHALPVSECVYDANNTQICDLYESDESGNPSETSSARTQNNPVNSPPGTVAPYGADWAPRWVVVYKDAAMQNASSVVQVIKSLPPVLDGMFAEEAFLYSDGYANFATILDIALTTPACNAGNTDTLPCLLKIVEDANGVATFQQPFVFYSKDPNSTTEGSDTINVHRLTSTTTTYRASVDFSSTQGFRDWYYLYGSGTQMSYVNGRWQGNEAYLLLWANGGHPGNFSDAIRRWKAPQAGSVNITGNAFDGHTTCGSGASVYIKKNSTILWQQPIANGNTAGVAFNQTTTVVAGDNIDFGINRGADNVWDCDWTGFDPTILFTSP